MKFLPTNIYIACFHRYFIYLDNCNSLRSYSMYYRLFSLLIAQKLKKYQHILLNWRSSQNRRNKQQILQLSKHVRECLFSRFLKISREHRVPFLGFILIAWCKKKRGEYYLALAMNNSHLPFCFTSWSKNFY